MTNLSGKVALVTGSGRGIGKAIAERYGFLGASVVINFSSNEKAALDTVTSIEHSGGISQWPPFIVTVADPSDQWLTGTKKMAQGSRSPFGSSSGPPNTGDPGRLAPQSSAVIVFGV